jgi:Fe-S-cluster-containing hydrogenase component 2
MVKVDTEKCTGCGTCADTCPTNAITIENNIAVISEECIDCLSCIDECPEGAISEGD